MKLKMILSFGLVSVLILASCASYNASPLYDLGLLQTSAKEEEISIVSKTFTKADCKKFFDRNVIAKGYQPIQLYIQNNSNHSYSFSLNRISLPVAKSEEVAKKLHTSTVGRVVGYGAGALALQALLIFSDAPSSPMLPTRALFIPSVVDGVKSSEANATLDSDLATKTAKDKVIFPHSQMNAIIFIPISSYQDSFTITLIDVNTNEPKVLQVTSYS